jgi:hypothetical protein
VAGLLALVAGQQLDDLLADPVEVGAELDQDLRGDALALADQAEQDVLGADVVVAELQRLAQRELEHLLGARREGDVAARRLLPLADDLLDLVADALERDAEGLERLRGDALALVDQAEQDVLGPDVVVVEHPGLFLGQDDHPTGSVGETLEHAVAPHGAGTTTPRPRTLAPVSRARTSRSPVRDLRFNLRSPVGVPCRVRRERNRTRGVTTTSRGPQESDVGHLPCARGHATVDLTRLRGDS